MELKIGDRVRFLNEKGEGLITNINKQFATVEIEDGFEIPFLMTELVKVQSKPTDRLAQESASNDRPISDVAKIIKVERALSNSIAGEESVFLAFVPDDQTKLLSSPLQVYLVNNTSYQVVYSYASNSNNEDSGIAVGYIYPNTEKLLHTISRSEIEKTSNLLVQLLFHSKSSFRAQEPIQQRIPIKVNYFNNIDKLKSLGGINKHAFIMTVVELKKLEKIAKKELFSPVSAFKLEGGISSDPSKKYLRPLDLIFKGSLKEIEIDLHIEELIESFSGMSNSEILDFQINYFKKCMDKALIAHMQRILFIHGVGTGVLKKELWSELKSYKGIRFEDAPQNKYGGGATLVTLSK